MGGRRGAPLRAPLPPIEFPPELPVSAQRELIARAIGEHPVVIVCGETGSGKTTQLPKICLALGRGRERLIGHTQPRRIAATSIAARIAQELATPPGEVVGYKIRFADHTRPGAWVKLMTDGILLAETQADPTLSAYDTLIIDEAHERSLNIDFLLGYLKQLLPRRPDLKVVVTSATIDADRFARHFASAAGPAPVINVSGRMFPVELRYRPYDDAEGAGPRGGEDTGGDDEVPAGGLRSGPSSPPLSPGPGRGEVAGRAARRGERKTLLDAVVEAVDELAGAGRGDVLVFLPGEREIREAAEALRKHHPPATEILPLFARLSAEEQQRVFRPGAARRIVLATNVAETSLTVPGIRYVVDTGLARVKRYSYRNKVEQLRIEPVSQAAANQRAGRCGRVAAGICIRLYDEADFARRPAYTDPEILRSSLAAVILRMKSLGLGEPGDFPFVEAPPPRAIADGYQLLAELHAVDESNQLTAIGHELARLPVDPRVARMLLAAREHACLRELQVIAAVLSIQDPRERPIAAQEAADQAHRRRADERSDFLSFVRLWEEVQGRIEHKKSNRRLEEELRAEFLNVRRVREWIDVHGQLHQLVAEQGWRVNATPATYEQVHLALLTGLLGNIGCRAADTEPADRRAAPFAGARGIKFHLWPGSPAARKAGRWIIAAELVETSRLFARTIAQIEPAWIERVGEHLLRRSHGDPHWEKRPAQVVAMERGTLYGLMVYQQRRIHFGPLDPRRSREIFIREALVAGEFDTRATFFAHNQRLVQEIRELEHRTRRPDVLVDDDLIAAFYDRLLPPEIHNGAAFEHWRAQAEREQPRLLYLERDELMRHEAAGARGELFPRQWVLRGVPLALSYHFEPGSARDGVTLTVPLYLLNQVQAPRCEWLVAGMLKEKVQLLLKSLPQKLRRHCVPLPEYAAALVERWLPRLDAAAAGSDDATGAAPGGPAAPGGLARPGGHAAPGGLIEALVADLREHAGAVCAATDFKLETLPAHLIMNFKVVDEHGRQLAMGRNLASLRAELGTEAQRSFQALAVKDHSLAPVLQDQITDWDFGTLPELMEVRRGGHTLIGHPALVDRGEYCSIEVYDDAQQARVRHREGLRRLFRLQLREQLRQLEKSLAPLQAVQVQALAVPALAVACGSLEQLREQVLAAALDRACLAEPWPTERAAFLARKDEARGRLTLIAQELARLLAQVVQEAAAVQKKLAGVRAWPAVVADVGEQLARLFGRRFVLETPAAQLPQLPRYLKAITLRLDKLRADPARDAARAAEIARLQTPWLRELAARKGVPDERLEEFRWLLEELRVSLFAQELRTPMPVSVKRLEKVWASVQR